MWTIAEMGASPRISSNAVNYDWIHCGDKTASHNFLLSVM